MNAMKTWKEDDYVKGNFPIKIYFLFFSEDFCDIFFYKINTYWNLFKL